jgi:stage IV sporulation protein B
MDRERRRRLAGIIIAMLIVILTLSPQFRSVYSVPPHLQIMVGEQQVFHVSFPISVNVNLDRAGIFKINGNMMNTENAKINLASPMALESVRLGKADLEFRLFGIIPLRKTSIDVLPQLKVVPGGHSIGVVLHSQGVLVVGYSPVEGQDSRVHIPAKEANISIGDTILSINGQPMQSDNQVAEIINQMGQEGRTVDMLVKRNGQTMNLAVKPVLCAETKRYRIGLFVRDSAAGVGTMTFYDPKSGAYGALGHIITDSDTNQPIDVEQGKIVSASISGIQHGRRGHPGEKIGVFIDEENMLGNIRKNSNFGIFGSLNQPLANSTTKDQAISVASMSQVKIGPAEILTVVDGQNIERFSIEIQKVTLQDTPETKGMVIKITDPRLLEKTGGIIQGMSGSPIIQEEKLVGAVTHVFVHDPTREYGCFIDWMLMEAGVLGKQRAGIDRFQLFAFALQRTPETITAIRGNNHWASLFLKEVAIGRLSLRVR